YPISSGTVKSGTVKSGTIINSPIINSSTNITDDDDKRTSPHVHKNGIQDVKEVVIEDVGTVINELRAITKDDLPTVSFNAVVRKVTDMYEQNKIGQGNFRSYLMSALSTHMQDLQERRKQDKAKQPRKSYTPIRAKTESVPEWFNMREKTTRPESAPIGDINSERNKLLKEMGLLN
ncbi:hypothetical protein, partial [Sporosarcina sp. FSL K6-5500]|uniref:hypothetical protein n=1 Tax=Sporosarcina sp. FSL K6-5500 TaxID=2921558 RepID=UPI0030FD374D